MTYKVGMVGSRNFPDEIMVRAAVRALPNYLESLDFKIYSGGSRGVDSWVADETISSFGHGHLVELPASWNKRNRLGKTYFDPNAGRERNGILVRQCDEVIVFWDGKSPGSLNVQEWCNRYAIPYNVVRKSEDLYTWKK